MMRVFSLTLKEKKTTRNTKSYLKIQTAIGIVHSATGAKVFAKEFGTYLFVKLVENDPSEICVGRLCDELSYSYSWILTKGNKTVQCCTENIVPLVAVTKQSATPSLETFPSEHLSAEEKLVAENEEEETMLKLL